MEQEFDVKIDTNRLLNRSVARITFQGSELLSIDKNTFSKVKNFFQSKIMYLKMAEGSLIIVNIIIDGKIKIKDASNRISNNINNSFNIVKSYVATTKKSIIDRCKVFYSNVKRVVNDNKLIVDISHEVNLQRELYKKPVEPNNSQIRILNRKLNFNPDFCQKVNENSSNFMIVTKSTKSSIKDRLLNSSQSGDHSLVNKDNDSSNYKRLIKSKSSGYMSVAVIILITLVGILVLSFTIANIIIK